MMLVRDLIKYLERLDLLQDRQVEVWLPGERVVLKNPPFESNGVVMIQGEKWPVGARRRA